MVSALPGKFLWRCRQDCGLQRFPEHPSGECPVPRGAFRLTWLWALIGQLVCSRQPGDCSHSFSSHLLLKGNFSFSSSETLNEIWYQSQSSSMYKLSTFKKMQTNQTSRVTVHGRACIYRHSSKTTWRSAVSGTFHALWLVKQNDSHGTPKSNIFYFREIRGHRPVRKMKFIELGTVTLSQPNARCQWEPISAQMSYRHLEAALTSMCKGWQGSEMQKDHRNTSFTLDQTYR